MADLEAEMARFEAELASVSGAAGGGPQREVGLCSLAWRGYGRPCARWWAASDGVRVAQVGGLGANAHYPHAAPDTRRSQGAPLLQSCWSRACR